MNVYSTDSSEHRVNLGEEIDQNEIPDWYFDEEYKAISELNANEDEHEKQLRTMGVFN